MASNIAADAATRDLPLLCSKDAFGCCNASLALIHFRYRHEDLKYLSAVMSCTQDCRGIALCNDRRHTGQYGQTIARTIKCKPIFFIAEDLSFCHSHLWRD